METYDEIMHKYKCDQYLSFKLYTFSPNDSILKNNMMGFFSIISYMNYFQMVEKNVLTC